MSTGGDWWCGTHKSWGCRYDIEDDCEPMSEGPGYRSAAADYPLHRALEMLNGGPSALAEIDALRERARRGQYVVDCFYARKGADTGQLRSACESWDALQWEDR